MKSNENEMYEIEGMEADDLIEDIGTIKAKLNCCIESIEKGQLDASQVSFLKSLGLVF